jgi:hypothetical protein
MGGGASVQTIDAGAGGEAVAVGALEAEGGLAAGADGGLQARVRLAGELQLDVPAGVFKIVKEVAKRVYPNFAVEERGPMYTTCRQ